MAKNFEDIRKKLLGERYDVDGYYGAQCWDGYAQYMKELGYSYANCTKSGYVKDIYTERKTNGMLKSCDEVSIMQAGDIAVFRETPEWTPYSHIAIFVRDVDGEYGIFLGQEEQTEDSMKSNSHIMLHMIRRSVRSVSKAQNRQIITLMHQRTKSRISD